MTSEPVLPPVIGAIAEDRQGNALGTVTAVFVDDVTGEPSWVGLTDGLHAAPDASEVALVAPIADARFSDGRLLLGVAAEAVHDAPRPASAGRLSPAEEVTLHEHYRSSAGTGTTATAAPGDGGTGTVGRDSAMTRSEERLSVDSVTEPWTRAVLRIETVTEEVMVPVTITRQQARVEYRPLRPTDGTLDAGEAGSAPGQSTEWVTLYGEQPVVTLERVPVERVRLTTSWVTEHQAVTDQLRREQIELTTDAPL